MKTKTTISRLPVICSEQSDKFIQDSNRNKLDDDCLKQCHASASLFEKRFQSPIQIK